MKDLHKLFLLPSPYPQMHVQQTYVVIQHRFCLHADLLRNNHQWCILDEYATVSEERGRRYGIFYAIFTRSSTFH